MAAETRAETVAPVIADVLASLIDTLRAASSAVAAQAGFDVAGWLLHCARGEHTEKHGRLNIGAAMGSEQDETVLAHGTEWAEERNRELERETAESDDEDSEEAP